MTFGNRIKELRVSRKLSQKDLAKVIGVSEKDICRWEKDYCIPNMQNLEKLARFFEMTVDDLLGGNKIDTLIFQVIKCQNNQRAYYRKWIISLGIILTCMICAIGYLAYDIYNLHKMTYDFINTPQPVQSNVCDATDYKEDIAVVHYNVLEASSKEVKYNIKVSLKEYTEDTVVCFSSTQNNKQKDVELKKDGDNYQGDVIVCRSDQDLKIKVTTEGKTKTQNVYISIDDLAEKEKATLSSCGLTYDQERKVLDISTWLDPNAYVEIEKSDNSDKRVKVKLFDEPFQTVKVSYKIGKTKTSFKEMKTKKEDGYINYYLSENIDSLENNQHIDIYLQWIKKDGTKKEYHTTFKFFSKYGNVRFDRVED